MNIKYILDNVEVNQPVPLICGTVIDVKEIQTKQTDAGPYEVQSFWIQDSDGDKIRCSLKNVSKERFFDLSDVGKSFEFQCTSGLHKKNTGVVVRDVAGKKILSMTPTVIITKINESEEVEVKEVAKEITVKPLEPKKKEFESPAESLVNRYARERFWIFNQVADIHSNEYSDKDHKFPYDKLAELSTSIHIELQRSNMNILPHASEPRIAKDVAPVNKKEEVKSEPEDKGIESWRNYRNPSSGEKLSDLNKEQAKEKYMTFYFREHKRILAEEPKGNVKYKFTLALGEMFKEYKIRIIDAVVGYVAQYTPDKLSDKEARMRMLKYLEFVKIKESEITDDYLYELINDKKVIQEIAEYGISSKTKKKA